MSFPSADAIRAEAVYRVHRRHAGCALPATTKLAEEYDRLALHVESLARQYPWDRVVSKPSPEFLAHMRQRDPVFAVACDGARNTAA